MQAFTATAVSGDIDAILKKAGLERFSESFTTYGIELLSDLREVQANSAPSGVAQDARFLLIPQNADKILFPPPPLAWPAPLTRRNSSATMTSNPSSASTPFR